MFVFSPSRKNRFTLAELLVVIAVLEVLAIVFILPRILNNPGYGPEEV
jgi:Tfp pilus assembly protein FimT